MLSSIKALYQRALRTCTRLGWIGPLAIRIVVGVAFFFDGKGKLGNLEKVTDYFGNDLHIPFPAANAAFVSTVELVGGALLVLGLGTRISALLLAGTMAVAFLTAILPHADSVIDLFSTIELTYLAIFVWLIVGGPGPISIDHLLSRRGQAGPQVGEPA